MKYYKCEKCGNIVEMVQESGVSMVCCNQTMSELVPGTGDGAQEKHVPVVTMSENKAMVEIGEIEHPMVEEHYIQWIEIETTRGSQRVKLDPASKPRAEFILADGENVVNVYEYCNIHGLWVKKEYE